MSDRHRHRKFDPEEGVTCHYCNKLLTRRDHTKDHVVSRASGGRDEKFNIVDSCLKCNQAKADKWPVPEFCNCRFCRKSVRIHREAYNVRKPRGS